MSNQYENIPEALKELDQWVIAAPDKRPWSTSGFPASVTDPSTWTDFYSACMVAESWGAGIGFVLHEDDPFTCIDLDVKDDTAPELVANFQSAVRKFDSYTEYSRSGKGFHIWVRGNVGAGARRGGVELYDRERFIICTGNVVLQRDIEERQALLELTLADIRKAQGESAAILVEIEESLPDEEIWRRASTAANADKFLALWNGQWQQEYPSQSEADLSLLSMLTFYSKSNEQCRRLFRMSALGQREKATKNNRYIDSTLKLIRGRMEREELTTAAVQAGFEKLVDKLNTVLPKQEPAAPAVQRVIPTVNQGSLPWPPGFLGTLAQWMYAQAPRPVKEIAIVSALGVMAGLCGRAFNINRSGLNLYIVLVAKSAVGKEALHTSISKLVMEVTGSSTSFPDFIDFADYASGPALIKSLSTRNSFVNIAGEWGRKLRKMADDHAEGPVSSLRTVMTNLYQKSGAGTMVGGIGYSDKEKDVKSVDGVAYSMIGETTPDTFYESLTNTMMQDGFMSRFIVVEYTGKRPELVDNPGSPLPNDFKEWLVRLTSTAAGVHGNAVTNVSGYPDAVQMLADFNKLCDEQINSTEDESWRQMWNRAHLKALKVSGLLAVSDNPSNPMVTAEHATWALDLVKRDIKIMSSKIQGGDVGNDDSARERKLLSILREYLSGPVGKSYGVSEAMRTQGYVPRKYLQIRVQKVNSFIKFRNGQNKALDETLKSMVDSGYIADVPAGKLPLEYGFHGRCFRIVNLPDEML